PDGSEARIHYCKQLIQTEMAPMTLVDSSDMMKEIKRPNQSLGDGYIHLISEVLGTLKNLTAINLADNRLTDTGIQDVVKAIATESGRGILALNLSENKLDSVSAEALGDYLNSSSCSLQELYLAKADMDDCETHIFMKALERNKSITVLDFSNNTIGGVYEKIQNSGTTTGGAAIAQALNLNTTLRKLDLSWNRLGRDSGVLLGKALTTNNSLEWLSIAYNAIGNKGAQEIGTALLTNHGLRHLDLSYNDVTPKGAMVLAQALERNGSLTMLALEGNNIGFNGGRCLIRSLNYWTVPRKLKLRQCGIDSCGIEKSFFEPLLPTGRYKLDCSDHYERAVAYELLRWASIRPGVQIRSCSIKQNAKDRHPVAVKLQYPKAGLALYGSQRKNIGDTLARYELDEACMTADGVQWHEQVASVWVTDSSTGKPFYPPSEGCLELDVVWVPLPATKLCLVNASGKEPTLAIFHGIYSPAPSCSHHLSLNLGQLGKDLFFLSKQVQDLMRTCTRKGLPYNTMQIVELLSDLIPQIYDTDMIGNIVEMNLDTQQKRVLKAKIGHAFTAFTSSVCGHYQLDLGREFDREAAIRLAEWSNWEQGFLKARSGWAPETGGTSQKGKWSSFRNETYNHKFLRRGFTEVFFHGGLMDKVPGVMEFDFVSMSRPPQDTQPMNDKRFMVLLEECGLSDSVSK
ncbi:unnamed protein product, partial [Chrysoparadoxa australica]